MRKVIVFRYEKESNRPNLKKVRDPRGEALFHQWGCDYHEFETGPGNYSTAIIEWPSGQVDNIPATMIQFIERP